MRGVAICNMRNFHITYHNVKLYIEAGKTCLVTSLQIKFVVLCLSLFSPLKEALREQRFNRAPQCFLYCLHHTIEINIFCLQYIPLFSISKSNQFILTSETFSYDQSFVYVWNRLAHPADLQINFTSPDATVTVRTLWIQRPSILHPYTYHLLACQ